MVSFSLGGPLRIAIVNESFDAARGGAERCAVRLAGALEARRHEVRRIERNPRSGRIAGALRLASAARGARAAEDIVVSLCRAPGDVLYPQEGVHLAAVRGALARFAAPGRALAALGKLLSPRQWAFLATDPGRARPAPRAYLALSRGVRDDMVRLWGAPPERVEVCPNGVDCARFAPPGPEERARARAGLGLGLGPGEIAVLFVSNNYPLRGLKQLIQALGLARGPFRLVVAGRGRPRGYERLAAALSVRAHFAGEVEDVRPLLAAADIFALPTFYDTCSLATLEALAAGLPVVTSRRNGAQDLLSGREGEVIDDPRSIGAIAAALVRLRDPARRADCAAAARETALANPLDRATARAVEAIEAAKR